MLSKYSKKRHMVYKAIEFIMVYFLNIISEYQMYYMVSTSFLEINTIPIKYLYEFFLVVEISKSVRCTFEICGPVEEIEGKYLRNYENGHIVQ